MFSGKRLELKGGRRQTSKPDKPLSQGLFAIVQPFIREMHVAAEFRLLCFNGNNGS